MQFSKQISLDHHVLRNSTVFKSAELFPTQISHSLRDSSLLFAGWALCGACSFTRPCTPLTRPKKNWTASCPSDAGRGFSQERHQLLQVPQSHTSPCLHVEMSEGPKQGWGCKFWNLFASCLPEALGSVEGYHTSLHHLPLGTCSFCLAVQGPWRFRHFKE